MESVREETVRGDGSVSPSAPPLLARGKKKNPGRRWRWIVAIELWTCVTQLRFQQLMILYRKRIRAEALVMCHRIVQLLSPSLSPSLLLQTYSSQPWVWSENAAAEKERCRDFCMGYSHWLITVREHGRLEMWGQLCILKEKKKKKEKLGDRQICKSLTYRLQLSVTHKPHWYFLSVCTHTRARTRTRTHTYASITLYSSQHLREKSFLMVLLYFHFF